MSHQVNPDTPAADSPKGGQSHLTLSLWGETHSYLSINTALNGKQLVWKPSKHSPGITKEKPKGRLFGDFKF